MVSILREIIILLDFLSLCLGPSNFADLITALTTYTGACSASKPQFWYTNLQFCQSQYNSEGMKIVQSWPRPSKIWSNNDHFTTGGFIVKLKIQWMQWHFLQPVELCLFSWMMSALNVWFSVFDFVHTGLQGLLPDHFRKFPVHANSAYTCSSPNIKENEAAIRMQSYKQNNSKTIYNAKCCSFSATFILNPFWASLSTSNPEF